MTKRIFSGISASILILGISGFGIGNNTNTELKNYAFIVKGASGKNVMLDRTWYRDCQKNDTGAWQKSMRTLSGHELSTTIMDYRNGSDAPDCNSGASMMTIFVQTVTNDNVRVPITWTDAAGKPSTPPAGLEGVTEGNGASGVVTFATITPLTKEQADRLNLAKFAGLSDWTSGVTKDVLSFYTAGGSAKGTIVVDDRTDIAGVYDGISTNPKEYPKLMPNTPPHKGPLSGIEF